MPKVAGSIGGPVLNFGVYRPERYFLMTLLLYGLRIQSFRGSWYRAFHGFEF